MAIAEEDQKAKKCKATCQLWDGIAFPKILQSDDSGLSKSVLGGGTSTQQKTLQKQKCAQITFLMVNRPPATWFQCSLWHLAKSELPVPKKRRTIQKHHSPPQPLPILQTPHSESKQTVHHSFLLCTASLQLSRNADVKFYTGFNDTTQFKVYFWPTSSQGRKDAMLERHKTNRSRNFISSNICRFYSCIC